jgi:hypothetical protein
LPSVLEGLHEREELVVLRGVHLGVVQLEKVYVVRVQALEALLQGEAEEVLGPVLGALLLAAAGRVVVEVVAYLGRDHDLVAHVAEGVGEQRLALARAVSVGGVEVGDAPLVGLPEEPDGAVVHDLAPPARRDRPHPEPDLRYRDVRVAEVPVLHLRPQSLFASRKPML